MNVKHLTFHHFHQSQFLYEKLQLTKGSVGGRSWLQAGNHLSSDSLMQLLTEEPGPQFGRDKLKPAIIFQCQWSCSYKATGRLSRLCRKQSTSLILWRVAVPEPIPANIGREGQVASQSQGWHIETTTHVHIHTYVTLHLRLSVNLRVYGLSEEASGENPQISVKQISEINFATTFCTTSVKLLLFQRHSLKNSWSLTDSRSGQCWI